MCAGSRRYSRPWSSPGSTGVRECFVSMDDFPEFMKHSANRIAMSNQATPGVEGYVFDGADGSQMAFWACRETAVSAAHSHDYDEYMLVVQGQYTLLIDGKEIPLRVKSWQGQFTHLAGIGLSGFGNPREYRAVVNPGKNCDPFVTNDTPKSSIPRAVSPTAPDRPPIFTPNSGQGNLRRQRLVSH